MVQSALLTIELPLTFQGPHAYKDVDMEVSRIDSTWSTLGASANTCEEAAYFVFLE